MTGQIRNELLDRGLTDILHLPEIVSVVSRHLGLGMGDELVVRRTLEVIRELLESGFVIAGPVKRDGEGLLCIHSWGIIPSDAMKRIEHDWRELGREPKPGEVVWLELTDAGRAKARAIRDLSPEERDLVQEILARRLPELRDRISLVGPRGLNWEERQTICAALADELEVLGEGDDAKQKGYVCQLGDLVDRALSF